MSLFTKIFGPSKLQYEFQKACSLNWFVIVKNMQELEFSFSNSAVVQNFTNSLLIFDFTNNNLLIKGDIVSEVFNMNSCFQIIKNEYKDGDLVIYLGADDSNEFFSCRILRNSIQFDETRNNWYAKLHANKFQSFSSASYLDDFLT